MVSCHGTGSKVKYMSHEVMRNHRKVTKQLVTTNSKRVNSTFKHRADEVKKAQARQREDRAKVQLPKPETKKPTITVLYPSSQVQYTHVSSGPVGDVRTETPRTSAFERAVMGVALAAAGVAAWIGLNGELRGQTKGEQGKSKTELASTPSIAANLPAKGAAVSPKKSDENPPKIPDMILFTPKNIDATTVVAYLDMGMVHIYDKTGYRFSADITKKLKEITGIESMNEKSDLIRSKKVTSFEGTGLAITYIFENGIITLYPQKIGTAANEGIMWADGVAGNKLFENTYETRNGGIVVASPNDIFVVWKGGIFATKWKHSTMKDPQFYQGPSPNIVYMVDDTFVDVNGKRFMLEINTDNGRNKPVEYKASLLAAVN